MYDILIWGSGKVYRNNIDLIKRLEARGEFRVCGITSDDTAIKERIDGYPFVHKQELRSDMFDYCFVAVQNYEDVLKEASLRGIEKDKLLPIRLLSIPYFSLEQYIRLKNSRLTILSSFCWGGICYNHLGLEFLSPTINMFFSEKEFNIFLKKIEFYLSQPLEYVGDEYEINLKRNYPVGRLADVKLYFNHYVDFEQAKIDWERRKQRMNMDNLLIIHMAQKKETVEEFDALPYKNKLIFVPFECELQSAFNLPYEKERDGMYFGMKCNKIANDQLPYFDLIKFLNHEEDYCRIN